MPKRGIDPALLIFGSTQTIIALGILTAWFFTPLYTVVTPTCTVSIMPWGIIIRTGMVVRTLGTDVTLAILVLLILTALLSLAGTLFRTGGLFIIAFGTSVCVIMITSVVIFIINLLVGNITPAYYEDALLYPLFILTMLATANGITRYATH